MKKNKEKITVRTMIRLLSLTLLSLTLMSCGTGGNQNAGKLILKADDIFNVKYIIENVSKQSELGGGSEATVNRELQFTLQVLSCEENGNCVYALQYQDYHITSNDGGSSKRYDYKKDDPIMKVIGKLIEQPVRITVGAKGDILALDNKDAELARMIGEIKEPVQKYELQMYYNYFLKKSLFQEMFQQFYAAYPGENNLQKDTRWNVDFLETDPCDVLYNVDCQIKKKGGKTYQAEMQGAKAGDFKAASGFHYDLDIQMLGKATVTAAKGLSQNSTYSIVVNGANYFASNEADINIAILNRKSISYEIVKKN